jgi:CheY-like chemotaxis protein
MILVVDDNPANLALVAYLLTEAGYPIETARDAEEALALLDTLRPHLLLLDLRLPGMDGLSLCRALRSDPRRRELRIVALTAQVMRGDREEALGAGCDGFIGKPIDTRTFVETVAGFLPGLTRAR